MIDESEPLVPVLVRRKQQRRLDENAQVQVVADYQAGFTVNEMARRHQMGISQMDRRQPIVTPRVISVNVGLPRTVTWAGRSVTSAIWKDPVNGRIAVEGVNLRGDDQADRRVHGGPDKAVYAYAVEDYAWWTAKLGRELGAGTFGENLTTEGINLTACVIGQEWRVGTAVLQVAQPREPCFKLGMRMGDAEFVERFGSSGRSGTYLRIREPGDAGAGDPIVTGPPPAHGLTVGDLVAVRPSTPVQLLERIGSIDDVPEGWRIMARRRLGRLQGRA